MAGETLLISHSDHGQHSLSVLVPRNVAALVGVHFCEQALCFCQPIHATSSSEGFPQSFIRLQRGYQLLFEHEQ